jgi:hypothetical protein
MTKWAAEFKRGRKNIGDDERPGRPKEATNDKTAEAVHGHVRQKARPGKWVQALVQFRQF